MNGMIFAAGVGSRLAPLTNSRPKALVEVAGEPLIKRAVDNMYRAGMRHLVVNVHHFAQMLKVYLRSHAHLWNDLTIEISDESDMLLETGGGLVKALPLFPDDSPIIACNADILSNVDLADMYRHHIANNNDATLLMSSRSSTRGLMFDIDNRLMGWINKAKGEERIARDVTMCNTWAFNGFHIINQEVIKDMPQSGAFGIIDAYLNLAERFNIMAYTPYANYYWYDIGTPEKLATAEAEMRLR